MAVSPEGRGLGRGMMQACERWVVDNGMPKVQLMVRAGNAAVAAFGERLGYTEQQLVMGRRLDDKLP